jgi:hypothetical protein
MLNGYYRDGVVYINRRLADDGLSEALLHVTLEELSHHITQSTDNSRDFQDFLLTLAVKLFRKSLRELAA